MNQVKIIRESSNTGGGAVYGLGLIGAVIYFFGQAETLSQYALGLLKAIVWPALIIYRVLERLNF